MNKKVLLLVKNGVVTPIAFPNGLTFEILDIDCSNKIILCPTADGLNIEKNYTTSKDFEHEEIKSAANVTVVDKAEIISKIKEIEKLEETIMNPDAKIGFDYCIKKLNEKLCLEKEK
jgi:hypothetical protein